MGRRTTRDDDLEEFVTARTQDLHRDAYLLMGSQESAERLVAVVLTGLRRDHVDLSRAGAIAWLRMAAVAATVDDPPPAIDERQPSRFRSLAGLSPRQRAALALRVVGGNDERSTGRALHLSPHDAHATLASVPYTELPETERELRSLLEDFGDQAVVPPQPSTIADMRATPPPPRRPWWTYAAALLVIALTTTCLVVTGRWHEDWLRTPDGLNQAHGTRFPTFAQGYRLVSIREAQPGIAAHIRAGRSGAVALPCAVDASVKLVAHSQLSSVYLRDSCTKAFVQPSLTPIAGAASATVLGTNRDSYPLAVYRKIPRSEYPVAQTDFDVQHSLSLDAARREAVGGEEPPEAAKRPVLTMHGDAAHSNGTFTGKLRLPRAADQLDVPLIQAVGLLSPTTTGTFSVEIDHLRPVTGCGGHPSPPGDYDIARPSHCALLDRRVPQVKYVRDVPSDAAWVPVKVTVRNALGPWTLQIVADTVPGME